MTPSSLGGEIVHFYQWKSQSSFDVACGASQSCAKESANALRNSRGIIKMIPIEWN